VNDWAGCNADKKISEPQKEPDNTGLATIAQDLKKPMEFHIEKHSDTDKNENKSVQKKEAGWVEEPVVKSSLDQKIEKLKTEGNEKNQKSIEKPILPVKEIKQEQQIVNKKDDKEKSHKDDELTSSSKIIEVINRIEPAPSPDLLAPKRQIPVASRTPNKKKVKLEPIKSKPTASFANPSEPTKLSSYNAVNSQINKTEGRNNAYTDNSIQKRSIHENIEGEDDVSEVITDRDKKTPAIESSGKVKMAGPRIAFIEEGYHI